MQRAEERSKVAATPRRRQAELLAADDDDLLAQARAGAPDAFGELYRRHHSAAHRYAVRLGCGGSGGDGAEDVVAEAFRRVFSALTTGHGPHDGFRRYLFTCVRTVAFGATDRRPLPTVPPLATVAGPEDGLDRVLAMDAFRTLPDRWRHVLWATKVDEVALTELGAEVGLSAPSLAVLASRARDALRIAYVRAHLPVGRRTECAHALDALARATVKPISANQRAVLDRHVDGCHRCARASGSIPHVASWLTGQPARCERGGPVADPHVPTPHVA